MQAQMDEQFIIYPHTFIDDRTTPTVYQTSNCNIDSANNIRFLSRSGYFTV